MLMAVEGPYALMVQPDDILISPREQESPIRWMEM